MIVWVSRRDRRLVRAFVRELDGPGAPPAGERTVFATEADRTGRAIIGILRKVAR